MHIYCTILLTTWWGWAVDASIQTAGGKQICFDSVDMSPTSSHAKLCVWGKPWACLFYMYTSQSHCYVRQNTDYSGLLSGLINLAHGFICWRHFRVDDLVLIFWASKWWVNMWYIPCRLIADFLGFSFCNGSGRDGVTFLHSIPYGAVS